MTNPARDLLADIAADIARERHVRAITGIVADLADRLAALEARPATATARYLAVTAEVARGLPETARVAWEFASMAAARSNAADLNAGGGHGVVFGKGSEGPAIVDLDSLTPEQRAALTGATAPTGEASDEDLLAAYNTADDAEDGDSISREGIRAVYTRGASDRDAAWCRALGVASMGEAVAEMQRRRGEAEAHREIRDGLAEMNAKLTDRCWSLAADIDSVAYSLGVESTAPAILRTIERVRADIKRKDKEYAEQHARAAAAEERVAVLGAKLTSERIRATNAISAKVDAEELAESRLIDQDKLDGLTDQLATARDLADARAALIAEAHRVLGGKEGESIVEAAERVAARTEPAAWMATSTDRRARFGDGFDVGFYLTANEAGPDADRNRECGYPVKIEPLFRAPVVAQPVDVEALRWARAALFGNADGLKPVIAGTSMGYRVERALDAILTGKATAQPATASDATAEAARWLSVCASCGQPASETHSDGPAHVRHCAEDECAGRAQRAVEVLRGTGHHTPPQAASEAPAPVPVPTAPSRLTADAQARFVAEVERRKPATRHADAPTRTLRVLVYAPGGGMPLEFGDLSLDEREAIAVAFDGPANYPSQPAPVDAARALLTEYLARRNADSPDNPTLDDVDPGARERAVEDMRRALATVGARPAVGVDPASIEEFAATLPQGPGGYAEELRALAASAPVRVLTAEMLVHAFCAARLFVVDHNRASVPTDIAIGDLMRHLGPVAVGERTVTVEQGVSAYLDVRPSCDTAATAVRVMLDGLKGYTIVGARIIDDKATAHACFCADPRSRKWNPSTGRCESCGASYRDAGARIVDGGGK